MYSDKNENENEEVEEEYEESGSSNKILEFYQENKKMVLLLGGILLLLVILLLVNSCVNRSNNGGNDTPSDNDNVELELVTDSKENFVQIGRYLYITAMLKNAKDDDPVLEFRSLNTDVVEVVEEESGKIKGLQYGQAVVSCVYKASSKKEYTATITINVGAGQIGVDLVSASFKNGELLISVNEEYELNKDIMTNPNNAYISSEKYSSSNPAIVTIDSTGKIKANAYGEATITAVLNEKVTAQLLVNVTDEQVQTKYIEMPTAITFKSAKETVKINEEKDLKIEYIPSTAYVGFIKWRSNNPAIVTVNQSGRIVGVATGTTTVEVYTKSGISEKISVEVVANEVRVTGIEITSSTNFNLDKGSTSQIVPNVLPESATNKNVTYESSDTNIATVSSSGLITGISCGNATIVAKTVDGAFTKPIYVQVVNCSSSGGSSGGGSSGGGSSSGGSSSVGKVEASSHNKALEYSLINAQNRPVTTYPIITFTTSGNVDQVKFCYYPSSASSCITDQIVYSGPFEFNRNGIFVIKITPYYKGNAGTTITRYVNINTSSSNHCYYCSATGTYGWGSTSPTGCITNGYSEYECNQAMGTTNGSNSIAVTVLQTVVGSSNEITIGGVSYKKVKMKATPDSLKTITFCVGGKKPSTVTSGFSPIVSTTVGSVTYDYQVNGKCSQHTFESYEEAKWEVWVPKGKQICARASKGTSHTSDECINVQ